MPGAHIAGLIPLQPTESGPELHPLPGVRFGEEGVVSWIEDGCPDSWRLRELKEQGPGKPLSDISGTSVLKVNKRILRT